jgi:hypothetical protein
MKRLIFIPFLFISIFCFSQVDTILGYKGKLIKDTALTIDGNYLFTPSRNHISFDSSKLIWFLNGSKAYTDVTKVGLGTHTPRSAFMILNNASSLANDSTGIVLENDSTMYSPPLTFFVKSGGFISGWKISYDQNAGLLRFQQSANGITYTDKVTFDNSGNATFRSLTTTAASTFATQITTPFVILSGVTLNGGSSSTIFAINQTTPIFSPSTAGGYSIAPVINVASATAGSWKGVYFNPTLTNYPNIDLVGFQNETGKNLLNSTSGNTGVGVTSIDRSAKLQVGGTAQGVLFPVMTQSQRDSLARPVASVTVVSGGSGYAISSTTGLVTFSVGAIQAKGQYVSNSSGVITSVTITDPGAYGAGQTPTCSATGTAVLTPVLGASAPATGLTVFCSNCTANDSSTGVYQTWNGSTWKNWW